ncbi:MAG: NYN domain-containing protein [Gammaproteobacteria bacterium]|nr:NYN domain-containing protein [Gammaproteobacteria bacterium]MDA8022260.1 NYN domain-containing protein [Gammaproteobacteria bacterium]
MPSTLPVRAVFFIDGSNWYHALKKIGVRSDRLDYQKVARKLAEHREVRAIHYYVGALPRMPGQRNHPHTVRQREFLRELRAQGVQVFLGRVVRNYMPPNKNPAVETLRHLLAEERASLSERAAEEIARLCRMPLPYYIEKQVDTRITADLIGMAHRGEYDAAYLLSADSDFVPALDEARSRGKLVFAAGPGQSAQLAAAADNFIRLKTDWFSGLRL